MFVAFLVTLRTQTTGLKKNTSMTRPLASLLSSEPLQKSKMGGLQEPHGGSPESVFDLGLEFCREGVGCGVEELYCFVLIWKDGDKNSKRQL